jgi:hypothetical protein
MVAWFKHDIPAWMDGTEGLDDGPYRAYHVICQLIYLNEGPIALNEHGIAGRCKQSIRSFRTNLKILIDSGKLSLSDGRLSNSRAQKELEKVGDNRVNAREGGIKSGEARNADTKSLKTNDPSEASLQEDRSLKTRLDETRQEISPGAKPPRTKQEYSEEFETKFWLPYPRSPTMAKKEAWREWMKLSPEQREAACKAIEPYKKYLRSKPNLETVHACRFLSQQRFDGFINSPASPAPTFDIRSHLV